MKFQVEAKSILGAATSVTKGIRLARNIPVLECILITGGDTLELTATDMDAEAAATCADAAVGIHGACCVNAAMLKAYLSRASGIVAAELSDGDLHLSCPAGKITIPALPGEDFPSFPADAAPHEVSAEEFLTCVPFASDEETKFYLRGVSFNDSGVAASDGHRLMAIPRYASPVAVIIPRSAQPILAGMKSPRLFVGERVWRAESEGFRAMGKMIDGTFPDWTRIRVSGPDMATVEADDLARVAEMALVGCERSHCAIISGAGDTITMESDGEVVSSASCRADVSLDFCGGINAKYLLTALKAFSGGVIRIYGSSGCVGIAKEGDDRFVCAIMAMRSERDAWPETRVAAE